MSVRMAHFAFNRSLVTCRQLIPYANLVKIYVCRVIDNILDARMPPRTSTHKIYISLCLFSYFSSTALYMQSVFADDEICIRFIRCGALLQIYFQ